MSDDFHCWYPVQVRFRDLDPLAHVNNTVYFIYFEEARSHYFNQLGSWPTEEEPEDSQTSNLVNPRIKTEGRASRYGMLVKEMTCTYELPLLRSDSAEVGTRVIRVGRTSITMRHQIRDTQEHERIFATGTSIMVWCDYKTGRPYPVPASLRQAIQQIEGKELPI